MAESNYPEKTNWYQCVRLLMEGGREILKEILKQSYKPGTLDEFLNHKSCKDILDDLLNKRHILNENQWDQLVPHADIDNLDISLLSCIILNCVIQPNSSQRTAVEDIRNLRNSIFGHASTESMTKDEFERNWKEIRKTFSKAQQEFGLNISIDEISDKIQKEQVVNVEVLRKLKAWEQYDPGWKIDDKGWSELQNCLVNRYKILIKSPVTAAPFSTHETEIDDIYEEPQLKLINHKALRKQSSDSNKKSLSLKDIFLNDGHKCYNIYVTGDAGIGKTSLCKFILSSWCKTRQDKINNDFNYLELTQFDFLFYISLRHATGQFDIEEMIESQLLKHFVPNYKVLSGLESKFILQELFKLFAEKCLIILDGLDEWTAHKKSTDPSISNGVPMRNPSLKYTIMTFTRPWKLEELRLKDSELDRKIQITGVKNISVFGRKLISYFNKQENTNMTYTGFEVRLKEAGLVEMQETPFLLKHLICLWFNNQEFGKSKTDVYTSLLELWFQRAEKRENKRHLKHQKNTTITIPKVFKKYGKCDSYKTLLMAVGKLAFKTLMHRKGMQLVFDSSEQHGVTKDQFSMPATRKSVATPVRATRSHGGIPDTEAKLAVNDVRLAKHGDAVHKVVISNDQKKGQASAYKQDEGLTEKHGKEAVRTPQTVTKTSQSQQVTVSEGITKRSMTTPSTAAMSIRPVVTPTKEEDVFSPRRSSRAVVPNSRFKDMELLGSGRKRPAEKETEKPVKSRKKDKAEPLKKKAADVKTSQSENNQVVMEEVVTEETHIDTMAQMTMFDDLMAAAGHHHNQNVVAVKAPVIHVAETVAPSVSEVTLDQAKAASALNEPILNANIRIPVTYESVVGIASVSGSDVNRSENGKIRINLSDEQLNLGSAVKVANSAKEPLMQKIVIGGFMKTDEYSSSERVEVASETVVIESASGVDSAQLSEDGPVYIPSNGELREMLDSTEVNMNKDKDQYHPGGIVTLATSVTFGSPSAPDSLVTLTNAGSQLVTTNSDGTVTPQVIVIPSGRSGKTLQNSVRVKATLPVSLVQDKITSNLSEVTTTKPGIGKTNTQSIQKINVSPRPVVRNQHRSVVYSKDQPWKSSPNVTELNESGKPFTGFAEKPALNVELLSQGSSAVIASENMSVSGTISGTSVTASKLLSRNKIVYLKARPKSDPQAQKLRYEVVKVPLSSVTISSVPTTLDTGPLNEVVRTVGTRNETEIVAPVVSSDVNVVCSEQLECFTGTETVVTSNIDDDHDLPKMLIAEETIEIPQAGQTNLMQLVNTDSDGTIVTEYVNTENLPGDRVKMSKDAEKINTSLCQVIEYERHKELLMNKTQTAIEYVMFANKMVPIHKPFSQGKQSGTRQAQPIRSHGRVEIPGMVKKTTTTPPAGGPQPLVNQVNSTSAVDCPEKSETQDAFIHVPQTVPKVVHGYIDNQHLKMSEPTHVIEISQDLFTKEVYGDSFMVDPVTGEMTSADQYNRGAQISIKDGTADTDKHVTSSIGVPATSGELIPVTTLTSPDQPQVTSDPAARTESATTGQVSVETDLQSNTSQAPGCEPFVVVTIATTTADSGHSGDNKSVTSTATSSSVTTTIYTNIPQDTKIKIPNQLSVRPTKNKQEDSNVIELMDVKIVPAKAKSLSEVKTSSPGLRAGSSDALGSKRNQTVTMATKVPITTPTTTATKSEIETQTDELVMDEDDEDDEDDEEEEGFEVSTTGQTIVIKHDVNTSQQGTSSNQIGTHVMRETNPEYVVVHLPEGTEIKQHHARPIVKDPLRDEVVTMTADGLYVCMDCGHTTDKKSNWYKHRRKHLGIRPHACTKCSYKAASSSNLKRHMQIHDDVRNFSCTICGLMFRQKIHLERHIKYKHQEKNVKCPLCDYMCANENPDLKIHIRRRHMPEDGSMSAFSCLQCGLMTVSRKDLKQHMKFHKKGPELKLFCEYCSFVTDCESRLRRHVLIHTKERPFQCGLCSYRATQKEHVLRHMRSQHDVEVERKKRQGLVMMKDKRRRSLLEGLHFTSKDASDDSSDTDRFERSDYSSTEKIFACNHCSMKFAKLINLYKHLYAQHRELMPEPKTNDFQCVVCEFKTNSKKNLLVHMRKHNMQDHNPPSHVYSCVLCRYINPRRRNLFQHMKKKHGIEIMMKEDGMNCYVTSDNSTLILSQNEGETSEMALSDIVHTQALDDDSELHIVTDNEGEYHTEKISIDNIIAVEDMSSYVSGEVAGEDSSHTETVVINALQGSAVQTHEAAEAIEGLQALAQQSGPLDITEMVPSDILTEGTIEGIEHLVGAEEEQGGIQLSTDQLNQLSSGDYVEINGEVYKVEIAQETATK